MKRNLLTQLLVLAIAASAAFAQTSKEWQDRTRLAKQLDIGESAPDWLVDSESYAIGYNPNDWDALAQSKVAFITFDKPGRHVIEIVDAVPADMKTAKGYGSGERLGQFMDPSNPTKPSGGKKFKFREWEGAGKSTKIEVDVSKGMTLTAKFDVEVAKK